MQIANNSKPDIAISIQQNFFSDDAIGGTETFYYPGDAEGKKISEYIHGKLTAALMLKDMGAKPADLYVLRETNSPSVMLNIACLSNPEEERLLSEPQFRQKAAKAIVDGIKNYYHD